jgi:hypothetical protein
MLLQELKSQVLSLSVRDRLEIVRSIIDSIQDIPSPNPNRTKAIRRMKGLLKTAQPAPTDAEVEIRLEQHFDEAYHTITTRV